MRSTLRLLLLVIVATTACGKKGPPLPPLLLVPVPPPELTAVRRGSQVDLTFRIPNANTDRSTPADLARVEIYALTSLSAVTADAVAIATVVGMLAAGLFEYNFGDSEFLMLFLVLVTLPFSGTRHRTDPVA